MTLILIVAAALCLFWLQESLYLKFWNKGLTAQLEFQREAAVCGEEAVLYETVTNSKFLPIALLSVKFRMGRGLKFLSEENSTVSDFVYRNDSFSVFPYQKIRRSLRFQCKKRGYYEISQMELVSCDLFFALRKACFLPVAARFYVYPAVVNPERLKVPFRQMTGSFLAERRLCRDPFELQGIREYQVYDSMRDINWKASARTGQLKVNVYQPTASQGLLIFLNLDSDYPWASEEEREESISLCAAFLGELTDLGIPVGFVTNGTDCFTGKEGYQEPGAGKDHGVRSLECLSRLTYDHRIKPMEEIMEQMDATWKKGDFLYLLISSCQRKELSAAFETLCRLSPGSMWIAPLRQKEELRITGCPSAVFMRWEVEG
ncbi:MAG TPA: DUF58 domain-containing protein [Candidatus Hungatella pullicola]|nr:DUF58 domain-containing protein [Candidatus Hungatella pullicola]